MYVPKHHEETDISVLQSLIRAHPLGTWATQGDGELIVNHVPFLIDPSRGECGTLIGHVARANGVWQSFSKTVRSVVIFQGAESYITPSWYPSKHAHGKAVPTWNYVVVHAHGLPLAIDDKAWLLRHLNELTDVHEGWVETDAEGNFEFQTIRPAADYLGREGAHIHFTLESRNFGRQWAPTVFLSDDPLVPENERRRSAEAGEFGWVREVEAVDGVQHVDVKIRLEDTAEF
jgi:transcriptional regulator